MNNKNFQFKEFILLLFYTPAFLYFVIYIVNLLFGSDKNDFFINFQESMVVLSFMSFGIIPLILYAPLIVAPIHLIIILIKRKKLGDNVVANSYSKIYIFLLTVIVSVFIIGTIILLTPIALDFVRYIKENVSEKQQHTEFVNDLFFELSHISDNVDLQNYKTLTSKYAPYFKMKYHRDWKYIEVSEVGERYNFVGKVRGPHNIYEDKVLIVDINIKEKSENQTVYDETKLFFENKLKNGDGGEVREFSMGDKRALYIIENNNTVGFLSRVNVIVFDESHNDYVYVVSFEHIDERSIEGVEDMAFIIKSINFSDDVNEQILFKRDEMIKEDAMLIENRTDILYKSKTYDISHKYKEKLQEVKCSMESENPLVNILIAEQEFKNNNLVNVKQEFQWAHDKNIRQNELLNKMYSDMTESYENGYDARMNFSGEKKDIVSLYDKVSSKFVLLYAFSSAERQITDIHDYEWNLLKEDLLFTTILAGVECN